MPSPTTALQIIEDALALSNAIGTDQSLTADEASDCLRAFNDLLEEWSTQDLAVWGAANQSFNTVASQAVYTIGVGGDWNTTRPVNIEPLAFSTINGVTFPCRSITQAEYNAISVPSQEQQYPQRFLYVNEYPLGLVTLWPVPNAVTPITFSINRVLSQIASVGAAISFPPGYAKAFRYMLAVELAPMFGQKIEIYPDVVQIAKNSLASIKRANHAPRVAVIDPAYDTSGRRGYWNWRSG